MRKINLTTILENIEIEKYNPSFKVGDKVKRVWYGSFDPQTGKRLTPDKYADDIIIDMKVGEINIFEEKDIVYKLKKYGWVSKHDIEKR